MRKLIKVLSVVYGMAALTYIVGAFSYAGAAVEAEEYVSQMAIEVAADFVESIDSDSTTSLQDAVDGNNEAYNPLEGVYEEYISVGTKFALQQYVVSFDMTSVQNYIIDNMDLYVEVVGVWKELQHWWSTVYSPKFRDVYVYSISDEWDGADAAADWDLYKGKEPVAVIGVDEFVEGYNRIPISETNIVNDTLTLVFVPQACVDGDELSLTDDVNKPSVLIISDEFGSGYPFMMVWYTDYYYLNPPDSGEANEGIYTWFGIDQNPFQGILIAAGMLAAFVICRHDGLMRVLAPLMVLGLGVSITFLPIWITVALAISAGLTVWVLISRRVAGIQ